MADIQETQFSEEKAKAEPYSVRDLKRDLEGWREILIPVSRFLTWEQPWYPAVIFAVITIKFLALCYFEPSVLTTVSLIGLALCIADYVVPLICTNLFDPNAWSGEKERQYEIICEKLLRCRTYKTNACDAMHKLKDEKPKVYFIVNVSVLITLAWIGHMINNMLLTYLIVLFLALLPGLRHHGIIKKCFGSACETIMKQINKAKKKTN